MPYRTPSPPPPPAPEPPKGLKGFWNGSNGLSETRAAMGADTQIISGLKKLMRQWHKVTQNKYPKDYYVILVDLDQATLGKADFIKVGGKSKYLIGVLTETARLEGLLEFDAASFDRSTGNRQEMAKYTREAAVRWIGEDDQVRQVLDAAFASNASKLDKFFLAQYPDVTPKDVMEAVYFRAVAQNDMQTFESPALAQDLYKYIYD